MQGLLVFVAAFFLLAVSGPSVGNVFSNVLEEVEAPSSVEMTAPDTVEAVESPLCTVEVIKDALVLQALPDVESEAVMVLSPGMPLAVFDVSTASDGQVWYRVGFTLVDERIRGWVPVAGVMQIATSPDCP